MSDETGYRIERSADGTSGWTTIATTGQDVTTYTDAGLSSGTTYFYRLFAVNVGGESPPSNESSATTATDQVQDPLQTDPATADPTATEPSATQPLPTTT